MSKDVSLIEAIQKLTAAVEANTAAVMQSVGTPAQVPAERNEAPADEPLTVQMAPGAELDYTTDVKPVLLKLIGKDREKAGKVLAAFGAKKGDQVPAESLATFLIAVQTALADG